MMGVDLGAAGTCLGKPVTKETANAEGIMWDLRRHYGVLAGEDRKIFELICAVEFREFDPDAPNWREWIDHDLRRYRSEQFLPHYVIARYRDIVAAGGK